eukprot:Gregarina_sp_Poly_1__2307@NODE_1616_length_3712_cov_1006_655693_g1063_i0_p1_GENE_NODE_1616_length_3712_cov_1006_655693_g1063_i0NODE_1616_length_3712_cov_1006_655693_g1063_i0_p1_ORF_typecomplete_len473_score52_81GTP_cyclohydroI/PF01227_22/1_6e40QueF/PF14489_6/0_0051_NODE_1616_length_3712_cov_1006_655693_g1063_i021963614
MQTSDSPSFTLGPTTQSLKSDAESTSEFITLERKEELMTAQKAAMNMQLDSECFGGVFLESLATEDLSLSKPAKQTILDVRHRVSMSASPRLLRIASTHTATGASCGGGFRPPVNTPVIFWRPPLSPSASIKRSQSFPRHFECWRNPASNSAAKRVNASYPRADASNDEATSIGIPSVVDSGAIAGVKDVGIQTSSFRRFNLRPAMQSVHPHKAVTRHNDRLSEPSFSASDDEEVIDQLSCDCEVDKNHLGKATHFTEHIAAHWEAILSLLGAEEDTDLNPTYMRAARALWAMTHGHRSDPFRDGHLLDESRGVFSSPYFQRYSSTTGSSAIGHSTNNDLRAIAAGSVTMRRIAFTSLCEHHVLPFFGHVSICYIPAEVVLGLSKLVRVVRSLSKMLQMQERLTVDIADTIDSLARPRGVFVQILAKHTCLMARGVEAPGDSCEAVTTCARGLFEHNWEAFRFVQNLVQKKN